MRFKRIIDLSHPLRPGREARRLDIKRLDASEVIGAQSENDWYIMHSVGMNNHLGTHVEVPYHCLPEGADLARVPIVQFVGEAVILDLRGHGPGEAIPLAEVRRAAAEAGGVFQGDIAFCMTGWSALYGTEQYTNSPYLATASVRWLVDQGIKILGIDTMGAMEPTVSHRENHLPIFREGTLYVENLTNLEELPDSRVTIVAQPPAIEGLEAFPIRVVALL